MTKSESIEVAEKIGEAFKKGYALGLKDKSEQLSPLIERLIEIKKELRK